MIIFFYFLYLATAHEKTSIKSQKFTRKKNERYSIQLSRRNAQEGPTFNERPTHGSNPEYSTIYYDRVANVGFLHIVDGVEYEVPAP